MTGRDGLTVYALPHDRLEAALHTYNRWVEPGNMRRAAEMSLDVLQQLSGVYRGSSPLGEVRLYVEDAKLYLEWRGCRRHVVPLTDGRLLMLGMGGYKLAKVAAEAGCPFRLQVVLGDAGVGQLELVQAT